MFEASKGLDAVEELARTSGGYLVARTGNAITIRVPSEAFEAAVAAVTAMGDVLRRDVNVQDVTAEFRDAEVRLENLHAVRDRLEGLLAKAANVQEAIAVERELERVTAEIEQLKGRLKLLGHLVAYSTIHVAFEARPVERVDPIDHEPRGEVELWTTAVANHLRRAGYALLDSRDVKTATGLTGKQLRFGHDEGERPHLYYVTLFVTDATIYVLEAGGTAQQVEASAQHIDWAVENFRPR